MSHSRRRSRPNLVYDSRPMIHVYELHFMWNCIFFPSREVKPSFNTTILNKPILGPVSAFAHLSHIWRARVKERSVLTCQISSATVDFCCSWERKTNRNTQFQRLFKNKFEDSCAPSPINAKFSVREVPGLRVGGHPAFSLYSRWACHETVMMTGFGAITDIILVIQL